MKRILILASLIGSMFCLSVSAEATARVDRRQAAQNARIRQGLHSGQLTRGEAVRLRAQQASIRAQEARIEADGIVTRRERVRLERRQGAASRDIQRLKHNGRRR